MAKYVLECPECMARFNLRRHAPGKRVRCRKCRAVIIIPGTGEAEAGPKPLDPRLQQKLVKVLSLKKMALVSLLLVAALAGGAYFVIVKRRAQAMPAEMKIEAQVTLETMPQMNRLLALPLGRGFAWEYGLKGGGTEERRVTLASSGADGAPEFDVIISGSRYPARLTLRVHRDGVYLVSELRGESHVTFTPPLLLVPHPLHADDAWKQVHEGWGWNVEFVVRKVEPIDSGAGRLTCFRVEVKGSRGSRPVDEVLWYAKGVGLVKRESRIDGAVEEATLMKVTQP